MARRTNKKISLFIPFILSVPDLDEEDAELTVKMIDISFPKYFEDKDEDGC
jgi:hypothetical protein